MIIEKDIKARVDLSAKDISGIINGCDFDVLQDVISKCSNSTLSFIATYYANMIKETNKNDFEKFVSFVNSLNSETKNVECKKTDKKESNSSDLDSELNIGDSVILTLTGRSVFGFFYPGFEVDKKYTVFSKKSSLDKTGDVMYEVRDRYGSGKYIFHSELKEMAKWGRVKVVRKSVSDKI